MNSLNRIAVVGGTGKLGAAMARRLALAGFSITIGSRDADRARSAALQLAADIGKSVDSGTNVEAADRAELVILTVPYGSHLQTLTEIKDAVKNKIIVDTTVPLVPPKVMSAQMPPEGCAAVAAQRFVGADSTVVSAFHNVAAHKLATDESIDCDVLVFGDRKEAREVVVRLAEACGLRGLHGGALANSVAAEALTSVLIFLNRMYSVDGAGIRITGRLEIPRRE